MKYSVVVCTYMRPNDIIKMLDSIVLQSIYPDEIIIVDASNNELTKNLNLDLKYKNLQYYYVDANTRGSAKQRNFGITKVADSIDIICFLDDDVVLLENYFEELLNTYNTYPDALGTGGYIINSGINWIKKHKTYKSTFIENQFDGWITKENPRNLFRKILGLQSNVPPGFMPLFSHGQNALPPSGKIYNAELIMSVVCSYRKNVLDNQKFDNYFVGYSLYEDIALSLKIAKKGKLYINTNAKLYHYHSSFGRPNKFVYGKMVVRNGWYVWRIKNPSPKLKDRFKWNAITILLIVIRLSNIINSNQKTEALTESLGRIIGWLSLIISKPKIENE